MASFAAFLPVTIQGERGRYAGQYLNGLFDSLDASWTGPEPLRVLVACPASDLDGLARLSLGRGKVDAHILDQDEVCPRMRDFPQMSGYFKQMILKLAIAERLDADFYLTLDADIYAIRDFGPANVLVDGKVVTQWERRSAHADWWEGSARLLGCDPEIEKMGLSVTPNFLSSRLARKTAARIAAHWNEDPYAVLCRNGQFETGIWTEYTLYSLGAGDELGDFHFDGGHVHSDTALFWGPEALGNITAEDKAFAASSGFFAIFQSSLLVDPAPYIAGFERGARRHRERQARRS